MEEQLGTNEITLTQIITLLKEYLGVLLRYWWLILVSALLFGGYNYYKESNKPTVYTALLKFMLNSEEGRGTAIGGIIGQFGGFLGNSSNPNMNKMESLLTTKKIIKTVMFTKVRLVEGGKEDYLANHYIDAFKMREKWIENGNNALTDFYFKSDDFENFDKRNNSISNQIYSKITRYTLDGDLERPHLSSKFDDSGSSMVDFKFQSTSEEFCYHFTNTLFDKLSDYYIDKTVEKQKRTLALVKHRTDSLKKALAAKEYQLANFRDSNNGIFKQQTYLTISELQREINMLSVMFAESIRSLETSRMSLQVKTPYITPLERPIYPIGKSRKKIFYTTIIGILIGSICMIFLIGLVKLIKDILQKEKEREAIRQRRHIEFK